MHVAPCCAGKCSWCSKYIQHGKMESHVQAHETEQILRLADANCQRKHRDVYDEMICIGPNANGFGPPCDRCRDEARTNYYAKKSTAHGEMLSPEEAAALRKRLGVK